MTKLQSWMLHLSVAALTITGAVFAWMKFAMKTDDPFAVANHPWQPYLLDWHVVIAPLGVFALGFVFAIHALPMQAGGAAARRRTGITSMLTLLPMILSGYLMQVLTNETLVEAMRITHWVSSILFVVSYVVHQLLKKNGNGKAAEGNGGAV